MFRTVYKFDCEGMFIPENLLQIFTARKGCLGTVMFSQASVRSAGGR